MSGNSGQTSQRGAAAVEVVDRTRIAVNPFVLVVDDDDLVRGSVARSLGRLGCRATLASDADEALVLLQSGQHRIDLVFSDIRMPGSMDGFGLAQVVQRDFPDIAILLTTGFAGCRPKEPGPRILYKPYKLAELAAAVRESLAGLARLR